MTTPDLARGVDAAHLAATMHAADSIRWSPVATVEKYNDDQTAWAARKLGVRDPLGHHFEDLGVTPYETVVAPGNLLTTAGLNRLTALLIGAHQHRDPPRGRELGHRRRGRADRPASRRRRREPAVQGHGRHLPPAGQRRPHRPFHVRDR